jgi:hypothetical protein
VSAAGALLARCWRDLVWNAACPFVRPMFISAWCAAAVIVSVAFVTGTLWGAFAYLSWGWYLGRTIVWTVREWRSAR